MMQRVVVTIMQIMIRRMGNMEVVMMMMKMKMMIVVVSMSRYNRREYTAL